MTFEELVNYANDKKAEVQSQVAEKEALNQEYIKMIKHIISELEPDVQSVKLKKFKTDINCEFRISKVTNCSVCMGDSNIPYVFHVSPKLHSRLKPTLEDVKDMIDRIPTLHAKFKNVDGGDYDRCVGDKYLYIKFSK